MWKVIKTRFYYVYVRENDEIVVSLGRRDVMINDFYDAWWFLFYHKIFKNEYEESSFENCLDVYVAKVNPLNSTIEDDVSLNTKTEVWLECGKYSTECREHNIDLDCGADTYEDAIIELANLVIVFYGMESDYEINIR